MKRHTVDKWQPYLVRLVLLLTITQVEAAYQLVWSDEFNNTSSNVPNRANWKYDIGGHGWGNNEIQYYTDRRTNSYVKDGYLYIIARKENYDTRNYTSARLKTQDLKTFQYGKIQARIRLPLAQGSWPAFWMLGSNIPTVGWPNCGEIDAMEWVNAMDNSIYAPTNGTVIRGSAHGPGYSGAGAIFGDRKTSLRGFHVYTVEWTPTELRYYMDGVKYFTATPSPWVFNQPFFIILNLALGGWGGALGPTVTFPMYVKVDYVRVYQDIPTSPDATSFTAVASTAADASTKTLTVASITMEMTKDHHSWGAVATIAVVDDSNSPIQGVYITGAWSGLTTKYVTTTTDAKGQVVLKSATVKPSGLIRFCVEGLEKNGYSYVPPSSPECNEITNW